MTQPNPTNLVDLERYPIHELNSARGQALLQDCWSQLAANGGANLPGFLRAESALEMAREAALLELQALHRTYTRNAYLSPDDPELPADHPRRQFWTMSQWVLANDQIPAETNLQRLYKWDVLTDFVAAVMGKQQLYRMADPFQALNLMYLGEGNESQWHYDSGEFTVTLLVQAAKIGGEFEFVPNIRSAVAENYAEVRRVFDDTHEGVKRYERTAGTLTLFRGGYSLHRVTPPIGDQKRITAILCYDERPDFIDSDDVNLLLYGERVRPILAARNSRPS
jgi:hypothetical protein